MYGKDAIAPANPTKAEDANYRYGFSEWSEKYNFVTKNLDIYAKYNQTNTTYLVTFLDGNGNVFETQMVKHGQDAMVPNGIPTKYSMGALDYEFVRWTTDMTNIRAARTIYPEFKESALKFIVRFIDQYGQLLSQQSITYGENAIPPLVEVPEATVESEYVATWDMDYNNIKANLEIRLKIEQVPRLYTYTYLNAVGDILKQTEAPHGSRIIPPADPIQNMTNQYVFTFVGWIASNNQTGNILTEDVEFTPYFSSKLREYTVRFLDGDNKVIDSQLVEYGKGPTEPKIVPTKTDTKQYSYTFKAWDDLPLNVYSNVDVRAIFYQHLQTYTIEFRDDTGQHILKTQIVEYGTGATEPSPEIINQYKPVDTDKFTYIFTAWSRPFGNVVEDMVGEKAVKAQYIAVMKSYTYTFYDDDHITILKQEKITYGSPIVAPNHPFKPASEAAQYVFDGWDKIVADVIIGDVNYYATYKIIPKTFMVVFYDGTGLAIEAQSVSYGTSAINPIKVPIRSSDDIYDYVFDGWDKEFINVTADLHIYPTFRRVLKTFEVTFIFYNGDVEIVNVEYGQRARIEHPERPGYYFTGWDRDISSVTESMTVRPLYAPKDYRITFNKGYDDDTIPEMGSIIAEYDSLVTLPQSAYSRHGYLFRGWKLTPDGDIAYSDTESFIMQYQNATLFADWLPITYDIEYYLFGGVANNITSYTIETATTPLTEPNKPDYKFNGWYYRVVEEGISEMKVVTKPSNFMRFTTMNLNSFNLLSGQEPEQLPDGLLPISEIPQGTTGNLELYATYVYDGYIKLVDNPGAIYLGTANLDSSNITITNLNNIREVTGSEENPIYLFNTYLGQKIGELRQKFINDDLEFYNSKGVILTDNDVVSNGMKIMLINNGEVKDVITVVLKGDLNGDGQVTMLDLNALSNIVYGNTAATGVIKLASMINNDNFITMLDLNAMSNHVYGMGQIIWEK
jgi:hypothetical protein